MCAGGRACEAGAFVWPSLRGRPRSGLSFGRVYEVDARGDETISAGSIFVHERKWAVFNFGVGHTDSPRASLARYGNSTASYRGMATAPGARSCLDMNPRAHAKCTRVFCGAYRYVATRVRCLRRCARTRSARRAVVHEGAKHCRPLALLRETGLSILVLDQLYEADPPTLPVPSRTGARTSRRYSALLAFSSPHGAWACIRV
ncbi:uncharacterized protein BXZ73DRAFT_77413 [Epithele typhae]|uniref:uncharacterized protein n=1 Tax=Epithele typhae TaxID=378194 RepID=UPI0020084E93|nr:uncharacterized protein BXZ73DRAFT_77413 [Epithele typhae]KAH9932695.1 hypothetical protein BXZ73DRAFT_77413 [Epithele typhae]